MAYDNGGAVAIIMAKERLKSMHFSLHCRVLLID